MNYLKLIYLDPQNKKLHITFSKFPGKKGLIIREMQIISEV